MLDYIKGELIDKSLDKAIIEVEGMGYKLNISTSTYKSLPEQGEKTTLFVHEDIGEDKYDLFGFKEVEERKIFRKLISVSRVGGTTANSILSTFSINELVNIVDNKAVNRLKQVKGIGKKSGERIILELRGKLGDIVTTKEDASDEQKGLQEEATKALQTLGYSESEAAEKARKAISSGEPDNVEEVLKNVLQRG